MCHSLTRVNLQSNPDLDNAKHSQCLAVSNFHGLLICNLLYIDMYIYRAHNCSLYSCFNKELQLISKQNKERQEKLEFIFWSRKQGDKHWLQEEFRNQYIILVAYWVLHGATLEHISEWFVFALGLKSNQIGSPLSILSLKIKEIEHLLPLSLEKFPIAIRLSSPLETIKQNIQNTLIFQLSSNFPFYVSLSVCAALKNKPIRPNFYL